MLKTKTLILAICLMMSSVGFAQSLAKLTPESSAYLISQIGQQDEEEPITIVAYVSEKPGPEFIYLLFFRGGQDGHESNEEKRAQLFNEFLNAGLIGSFSNGAKRIMQGNVICKLDSCSVIVP